MARSKIPGIYKITIIPTGKVYIGQTKDLEKRILNHKWAASTDKLYPGTSTKIAKVIREYGIDNVRFDILKYGDQYTDKTSRKVAEIEAICEYRANDPRYGYNTTAGGETGPETARKQSPKEKLRRANAVFLFNIKTQHVIFFFSGARGVGEYLGFDKEHQYGKDVVSHAIKRGLRFLNLYYVTYADYNKRHEQLRVIYERCHDIEGKKPKTIKRQLNTYTEYYNAVMYIDKIAHNEYGFSNE